MASRNIVGVSPGGAVRDDSTHSVDTGRGKEG